MKKHSTTILLFVVLIAGLALLLYPTIADTWNLYHQSRAVASYAASVAVDDETDYSAYWEEARQYNQKLLKIPTVNRLNMVGISRTEYDKLLNVSGSGILGVLEIPEIAVTLPLYHGTSEAVLQVAVGHLPGTSMPTGDPGTHVAVSAHRGLPSAKLFTNLDQLVPGDLFTLRVLDEVFTYEIDQILIVLPHEVSALAIDQNQAYCTLITCTPYGVNSHRMLVRGHRVENSTAAAAARITADAMQIDPMIVAPVVSAPMLLILLIIMLVSTSPKKKQAKARRKAITTADVVKAIVEEDQARKGGERP